MISKTLLRKIYSVFMVLDCPFYAAQLLSMHEGGTANTALSEQTSEASARAFTECAVRILSHFEKALSTYQSLFRNGAFSIQQPKYPLQQKHADEVKEAMEKVFEITAEKLACCNPEDLKVQKQKICDSYLQSSWQYPRLSPVMLVIGNLIRILNLESAMLKRHLDETAGAVAMEFDESASPVLHWFIDVCGELKNRLCQMLSEVSSSSSSNVSNP